VTLGGLYGCQWTCDNRNNVEYTLSAVGGVTLQSDDSFVSVTGSNSVVTLECLMSVPLSTLGLATGEQSVELTVLDDDGDSASAT